MIHPVLQQKIATPLSPLFRLFFRDEAASGRLILLFAVLALMIANSPLSTTYNNLWNTQFTIGFPGWSLSDSLRYWVNDGLMAIFFFVVGLEIKREFTRGELKDKRTAVLPIAAAVGGMVLPAAIYTAFNGGGIGEDGWGIPIATDIAFAAGVLALLSKRVPAYIKIFLLTLAIVDDMLAIVVIAIFYATSIENAYIAAAGAIMISMYLAGKRFPRSTVLYVSLAVLLWLAVKNSGIHASIAGAVAGILAPVCITGTRQYIAERMEKGLLPFSTFFVVPMFVFANAGVALSLTPFTDTALLPVVMGIVLGLVLGKSIGVLGATWIMTRLKLASLPSGINWLHILGVGLLAGIGFTVSIFITTLAFIDNQQLIDAAKIAIFIASIIAAVLGLSILRLADIKSRP